MRTDRKKVKWKRGLAYFLSAVMLVGMVPAVPTKMSQVQAEEIETPEVESGALGVRINKERDLTVGDEIEYVIYSKGPAAIKEVAVSSIEVDETILEYQDAEFSSDCSGWSKVDNAEGDGFTLTADAGHEATVDTDIVTIKFKVLKEFKETTINISKSSVDENDDTVSYPGGTGYKVYGNLAQSVDHKSFLGENDNMVQTYAIYDYLNEDQKVVMYAGLFNVKANEFSFVLDYDEKVFGELTSDNVKLLDPFKTNGWTLDFDEESKKVTVKSGDESFYDFSKDISGTTPKLEELQKIVEITFSVENAVEATTISLSGTKVVAENQEYTQDATAQEIELKNKVQISLETEATEIHEGDEITFTIKYSGVFGSITSSLEYNKDIFDYSDEKSFKYNASLMVGDAKKHSVSSNYASDTGVLQLSLSPQTMFADDIVETFVLVAKKDVSYAKVLIGDIKFAYSDGIVRDYPCDVVWKLGVAPTYTVDVKKGNETNHFSTTDAELMRQEDVEIDTDIEDIVLTADDGYYFPKTYLLPADGTYTEPAEGEDLVLLEDNGIKVIWDSFSQVTVKGSPTDNVEIILHDAVERFEAPTVTGGELVISGVAADMEYAVVPEGKNVTEADVEATAWKDVTVDEVTDPTAEKTMTFAPEDMTEETEFFVRKKAIDDKNLPGYATKVTVTVTAKEFDVVIETPEQAHFEKKTEAAEGEDLENQKVTENDAMKAVSYVAEEGYYFPKNYMKDVQEDSGEGADQPALAAFEENIFITPIGPTGETEPEESPEVVLYEANGVKIVWDNYEQITVMGEPTDNVSLELEDATKRVAAPDVTGGILKMTNISADMEYAPVPEGEDVTDSDAADSEWKDCVLDANSNNEMTVNVTKDTWFFVRYKESDTQKLSKAVEVKVSAPKEDYQVEITMPQDAHFEIQEADGEALLKQTVSDGNSISPINCIVDDDYYFPENYGTLLYNANEEEETEEVLADYQKGNVQIKRISATQIEISGAPKESVTIELVDALEKDAQDSDDIKAALDKVKGGEEEIQNTDTKMEYALVPEGEDSKVEDVAKDKWSPCAQDKTSEVPEGDYFVRYAGTDTKKPSEARIITVYAKDDVSDCTLLIQSSKQEQLHMTRVETMGENSQTVERGKDISTVVYEADTDYYIPEDYQVTVTDTHGSELADDFGGLKVERESYTRFSISGSLEKSVIITLTPATEKDDQEAPTGLIDGHTKIGGVTAAMQWAQTDSVSTNWKACIPDADGFISVELYGAGNYYVRYAETDTKKASPATKIEITTRTYSVNVKVTDDDAQTVHMQVTSTSAPAYQDKLSLKGGMKLVSFKPIDGYYFPINYLNGITMKNESGEELEITKGTDGISAAGVKVSRDSANLVKISGNPSDDVIVILPDATSQDAVGAPDVVGGVRYIDNVTEDMEYISKDDYDNNRDKWNPCKGNVIDGKVYVTAGIWYVRYVATGTSTASLPTEVEVLPGQYDSKGYTLIIRLQPDAGMDRDTSSGSDTQLGTNLVQTVEYIAKSGYYFPDDYTSLGAMNGAQIKKIASDRISISGSLIADTVITLDPASAKGEQTPPDVEAGNLTILGTTEKMEYAQSANPERWIPCHDGATPVAAGIWYVRKMETGEKKASQPTMVTVTGSGGSTPTPGTGNMIQISLPADGSIVRDETSGDISQSGLTGQMTPVILNAAEGYYFPSDYSLGAMSGVMASRNSASKVTVYGVPSGSVTFTLLPATPKSPQTETPAVAGAVLQINGTTTAMECAPAAAGATWISCSDISTIVPHEGVWNVRYKATDDKKAGPAMAVTVLPNEGSGEDNPTPEQPEEPDNTPGYRVTVYIPVNGHMTRYETTGTNDQENVKGPMATIFYIADEGYYFPADYYVEPSHGIVVTRQSEHSIAVSGTPTADTNILLEPASKERSPYYTLIVDNGTGSGTFLAGKTVTVSANRPATGMHFYKWTVLSGNAVLENDKATTATFVMPASNVELRAEYVKDATSTQGTKDPVKEDKVPENQNETPVVSPDNSSRETAENNANINKNLRAKWKKNEVALAWGRVDAADGYDVYAAKCSNDFEDSELAVTIPGAWNTRTTLTKDTLLNGDTIRKSKSYKFYVRAYEVVNGKKRYIATSLYVHIVGSSNKKFTNAKSVKVKKTSFKLRRGQTSKIKASIVKQNKKKKLLNKSHGKSLRYFSMNTKVATVDTKGRIRAVGSGTCYVYVIALNGAKNRVKVRVQ